MNLITKKVSVPNILENTMNIQFDDQYRLRLTTKKLNSGRCQVKFDASVENGKELYGYVLVDSDHTLKDVVFRIKEKLGAIQQSRDFHHIHLYSIGKKNIMDDMNFIIFDK